MALRAALLHRGCGLREIDGGIGQVDFLKRNTADIGVARQVRRNSNGNQHE